LKHASTFKTHHGRLLVIITVGIYSVNHKNVPPNFCPYLHQILTNFENSFTGTLCRQFAIKLSLKVPPHLKRVVTLPCEI